MKKLIKILIVAGALAAMATTSLAQAAGPRGGGQGGANMQQRMKQREAMMTKIYDQLGLTADQKKKIAALDKARAEKMKAEFSKNAGKTAPTPDQQKARREEFKKAQEQYDASLKKIMGEAKYTKFVQLRKDAMAKMRQNRGGGGRPGAPRGGGGGIS